MPSPLQAAELKERKKSLCLEEARFKDEEVRWSEEKREEKAALEKKSLELDRREAELEAQRSTRPP